MKSYFYDVKYETGPFKGLKDFENLGQEWAEELANYFDDTNKAQMESLLMLLNMAYELGLKKDNSLPGGITLKELVSMHIINPNSIVEVYEQDKNDPHCSNRIFKGMAWEMEKNEICNRKLKHIFSAISETISESDRICIEVKE